MSTRTNRTGVKRAANPENTTSTAQPSKRSKSNTQKPQLRKSKDDDNSKKSSPSCTTETKPENKASNPQDNNPNPKTTLTLTESTGDIFIAPPGTLLIHACNTEGSWGAGIAKAFKTHYPTAYKTYASHCAKHGPKLLATALLIPPQEDGGTGHYIGCLFTSRSKGKKKDPPAKILDATGPAMRDLLRQVREWNGGHDRIEEDDAVKGVRMCKINSGLFAVPWEKTKAVLEGIEVGEGDGEVREVEVISLE